MVSRKSHTNNILKRFKTSKGFTLIEITVVMAILTALIGIGIYTYPRHKEKTFVTEDSVHEKYARDEAVSEYLTYGTFGDNPVNTDASGENYNIPKEMYYDAKNEIWTDDAAAIAPYGKCTKLTHNHRGGILSSSNVSKNVGLHKSMCYTCFVVHRYPAIGRRCLYGNYHYFFSVCYGRCGLPPRLQMV